jgi:hypothetical protein
VLEYAIVMVAGLSVGDIFIRDAALDEKLDDDEDAENLKPSLSHDEKCDKDKRKAKHAQYQKVHEVLFYM